MSNQYNNQAGFGQKSNGKAPVRKSTTALIVLSAIVLVAVFFTFGSYNSLVKEDESVNTTWANLQAQYQRRADLVPNLVNTVKGYAQHEASTLEGVVEARAKATQMQVNADELTPEKAAQIQKAQGELSQALGRLMAIQENYPELKANENFSELQTQLEGTENRINESRRHYNESVKTYNMKVRSFPRNIVANLFGFGKRTPFEAETGADKAPEVKF